MSKKRILSLAPGQEELWAMSEKQGYVEELKKEIENENKSN